jgi:hypothetical protein
VSDESTSNFNRKVGKIGEKRDYLRRCKSTLWVHFWREDDMKKSVNKTSRALVDDYVIVYCADKKRNVLAKVQSIKDAHLNLVIADESLAHESTRVEFTLPSYMVKANLGDAPEHCFGSAYGVPLTPFFEKTHVKWWGDVLWMLPTSDDLVDKAEKVIKKAVALLKEDKYAPFVYITKMQQLDPNQAKPLRGLYHYIPKKEDKITYFLNDMSGINEHIVIHEFGHGVWQHILSDDKRADWIELYADCVAVDEVGANRIKSVLNDFASLKGKGAIKQLFTEYKKDDDAECIAIGKEVIKAIRNEFCLDRHDLDALLAANRSISKYTPKLTHLAKGRANTEVTPYSDRKAVEMFCESLALFYVDPDQLPDDVYKLMEDTLVTVKCGR